MEDIERTSPKSARVERTYDVSAERLASAVEKAIRSLGRWEVEASPADGDGRAVRSTRLLKFKDDVKIEISGKAEKSHATFESESRVGKSDLGQNPKNLEELLSAVDRELGEPS